jgi:CTP:molybdopterin cytidylyltransferase MocA
VGVANLSIRSKSFLLFPVDYPLVRRETLRLLIEKFNETKPLIVIPSYNNIKGHPPIFSIDLRKEFLELDNDKGINTVGKKYADRVYVCDVKDPGIIASFNTIEEFQKIIKGSFVDDNRS